MHHQDPFADFGASVSEVAEQTSVATEDGDAWMPRRSRPPAKDPMFLEQNEMHAAALRAAPDDLILMLRGAGGEGGSDAWRRGRCCVDGHQ